MIQWSMPHEWYSHQTTTHSNGNSYQHYERHSQWGPKKGLQCRVKLDQSIMWDSPHDWGSIPLQYRMQWADNIAAIAPSTPQLALSVTKNSVTWHPIPENPAPSGQPLENTQSPTLGSSTKANFPTQLADQQMEWSANWSNITCFKCGNPGHRRAECPCLKLGLRTATIRTKDSNEIRLEPTLQQVNEEGEGEPQNTEAQRPTEVLQDDWEPEPSQYYMWDDETAEEQTTYRSSTIRIAPEEDTTMKTMAAQTSTAPNKAADLMHHHQNKLHSWSKRSQEDNRTLSEYWEINSMKAHCLLDSGSKGMLISPKFTQVRA